MSSYDTPKYPTFEQTKHDSKLLRKLPSRWKTNVAVIACVGALGLGMASVSGCALTYNTGYVGTDIPFAWNAIYDELQITHHGGGGGAPIYLVHLSENEAGAILLARLKYFGLKLDSHMPYNSPLFNSWNRYLNEILYNIIEFSMYNSSLDVGIVFLDRTASIYFAQRLSESFNEISDMTIGVFYNDVRFFGRSEYWSDLTTEERMNYTPTEFTAEQLEPHRELLRQRMIDQADEFIADLRERGILE